MTITVSTNNPLYFASLFGVMPEVIAKASDNGISVVQSSIGFLSVVGPTKVPYGNVTVKGSAITLAKSNTLGPASKAVIKHQLEQLIVKAINETVANSGIGEYPPVQTAPIDTSSMSVAQKAAVTKMMNKATPVLPVQHPHVSGEPAAKIQPATPTLANTTVPGMPAIKLSYADKLGQQVKGTSEQSTYFLVAMLKGLNIAIRRTATKMSVRAEGDNLSVFAPALASMGMVMKGSASSPEYASVHYELSDSNLARKTIGALIGAVGFSNLIGSIDPVSLPVKK